MSTALDNVDAGPVKLALADIRIEPELQCRANGVNKSLVREYAEVMREHGPDVFPGVHVFKDKQSVHWLADGFTRCAALASIDETASIKVEIHEGSRRDALLFAAGANAEHGRARSPADKRKAVAALLAEPSWAKRADNWIAKHAKVSHTFVAKIRSTCNNSSEGQRETADGRTMDVSGIGGRKPVVEPVEAALTGFRRLLSGLSETDRQRFMDAVGELLTAPASNVEAAE